MLHTKSITVILAAGLLLSPVSLAATRATKAPAQPVLNQPAMPVVHKLSDYVINGEDFSLYAALDSESDNLTSIDGAVRQAWLDYRSGKAASALMALSAYVEKHPEDTTARYLLSHIYAADDNTSGAIEQLEQLVSHDPKFLSAYLSLAPLYLQTGNVVQADQLIGRGRSQWPTQPDLAVYQGELFEANNDLSRAEEAYLQALKLNPHSQEAHYRLGRLYLLQENYAAAEVELKTALALSPDNNQPAVLALAETYQRWNKPERAENYYGRLLSPMAVVAVARTLQKNGKTNEAVAVLNTLDTISANNPALTFDTGMLYAELKEPVRAQQWLTRFVQSAPATDVRLSAAREQLKQLNAPATAPETQPASEPAVESDTNSELPSDGVPE